MTVGRLELQHYQAVWVLEGLLHLQQVLSVRLEAMDEESDAAADLANDLAALHASLEVIRVQLWQQFGGDIEQSRLYSKDIEKS